MTLTGTIEEELLDAVKEPGGLDQVMQRHRGSKGPLYKALSSATYIMGQRLDQANKDNSAAEARGQELQEIVDPLQEQRSHLLEEVEELKDRSSKAEIRLSELEGLLERTQELGNRGFGEQELERLADLLGQIAASQGAPPEEGVAQFFQTMERYERIFNLDLEAVRAESRAATAQNEASRQESELKVVETRSKARIGTIKLVEKLLARGVKADDLLTWNMVLDQAGVTAENLTDSLGQYGSIELLVKSRQEKVDELQVEFSELEIKTAALRQERDNISFAIEAVQEEGLDKIKKASNRVRKQMDSLVIEATEIGQLRAEAAGLGEWVQSTRIFLSGNEEDWRGLSPEVIRHLVIVVLTWVQDKGRDIQVSPPQPVWKENWSLRFTPVRISTLLGWALVGLMPGDTKALAGRR